MQKKLDNIGFSQPIDTIVHLGAGRCSELDEHLGLNPRRVLLVEADPQQAETLKSRTAGLQEVKVICAAVSGKPGPAVFYRYNLPDASSLHPATGLNNLYPGLKLLESLHVEAVSVVDLLRQLQLQDDQENNLILDLPGEELSILRSLKDAKQLNLFKRVQFYCGREALYESGEPAKVILQWLQSQGFDRLAEDDLRDPDRPCWTFQLNPLQLKNQELKEQVEDLRDQLDDLTKKLDEQLKLLADRQSRLENIEKAKEEQAKIVVGLEAQIRQLTCARDEAAKLAAERQSKLEQLEKTNEERVNRATELQQKVEQLAKVQDEQSKAIADLESRLEQTTKAKDDVAKLAEERQQQIEQLTRSRDEQTKLAGERQTQIQQLTQARDEQVNLAAERQETIEQLTKLRDEQAKLAGERQDQLEQLKKALDEQAKVAAGRQATVQPAQCQQASLIDLHVTLPDGRQTLIPFNVNGADFVRLEGEYLHFSVPEGKILYLCSNHDGNFSSPPQGNQFGLLPDTTYMISGQIECREHDPIIWAIEYDDRQRIAHQTDKVQDNGFGIFFRTHKDHANLCLAIRFAGKGALHVERSNFHIRRQSTEDIQMYRHLESHINQLVLNATRQLEAFVGVQTYLATGERMPDMHGWPISPDLSMYLIDLLENNDYDAIIEFGSGTSTVLFARTLTRLATRRQGRTPVRQVAFEHLERFHTQTSSQLHKAGMSEAVQLVLAPLEPYTTPDGRSFSYYRCHDRLRSLADSLLVADSRILVFVDGPPAATGRHARYPAVPVILEHFKGAHLDILLDDYIRDDEKEIARLWLTEIQTLGLRHTTVEKKFEKDACMITIFDPENQQREDLS